jgi:dsDNA-specific endonuclease/ATPase MutS2
MRDIFKIGDKVKFIKSNDYGIITSIISERKLQVEDSSNFLVIVNYSDVIKFNDLTDSLQAYGNLETNKDSNKTNNKKNKELSNLNIIKIDLHIENIDADYHFMTNYEIIQKQLRNCESSLINGLNSKAHKIIIVHGIGEGVLKKEIHNLLKRYNLRYYESLNGGSTEVML